MWKFKLLSPTLKNSKLEVDNPSAGVANILQDWNRAAGVTFINGVALQALMKAFLDPEDKQENVKFTTDSELYGFFSTYILNQLDDKEHIHSFLEELTRVFHQGGLLNPVTAAAFGAFQEMPFGPADAGFKYGGDLPAQSREVHIQPTFEGFKVIETLTQRVFINLEDTDMPILPDNGEPHIYKAQAIVDVQYDADLDELKIVTEHNSIEYGSQMIQDAMDARSFAEVLSDIWTSGDYQYIPGRIIQELPLSDEMKAYFQEVLPPSRNNTPPPKKDDDEKQNENDPPNIGPQ